MSSCTAQVDRLVALRTEIELIVASLLPAETVSPTLKEAFPWHIEISSTESPLRIHVTLDDAYPDKDAVSVEVKGVHVGREEAEAWRKRVDTMMQDWDTESDTPLYTIMTTKLLPLLAPEAAGTSAPQNQAQSDPLLSVPPVPHHALITTHHLLSPTKKKLLHQLSSELNLVGFSKTGHPGIMYATGEKEEIDEWLVQVKSWNWLALRLRIACEPIPDEVLDGPQPKAQSSNGEQRGSDSTTGVAKSQTKARGDWVELEKVSEALDWMKKKGREKLLVDAGVGSSRDA